ncbi:hypothetical protein MAR_009078 [Mya arenaria]|uniref:Uncharacterized protein n=1 Tax=Mya arenaria TaxID=6604 RepID=A0ABY7DYD8_MYAAR|nr:hypothetical protein MAR_009078 [Mya arenaria]
MVTFNVPPPDNFNFNRPEEFDKWFQGFEDNKTKRVHEVLHSYRSGAEALTDGDESCYGHAGEASYKNNDELEERSFLGVVTGKDDEHWTTELELGLRHFMLWFPGGPPLTFLPFPMPDGDRRPGSCPDHECCGGHFLPPSEVIEKRLKVNIWLEHLNNVAANRERGQAKAAETRSLKKKELRTETTPGGAATSTATTHRSSARSPNHSQAQSAPDREVGDWKNWFTVAKSEKFDAVWTSKIRPDTMFHFRYSL